MPSHRGTIDTAHDLAHDLAHDSPHVRINATRYLVVKFAVCALFVIGQIMIMANEKTVKNQLAATGDPSQPFFPVENHGGLLEIFGYVLSIPFIVLMIYYVVDIGRSFLKILVHHFLEVISGDLKHLKMFCAAGFGVIFCCVALLAAPLGYQMIHPDRINTQEITEKLQHWHQQKYHDNMTLEEATALYNHGRYDNGQTSKIHHQIDMSGCRVADFPGHTPNTLDKMEKKICSSTSPSATGN